MVESSVTNSPTRCSYSKFTTVELVSTSVTEFGSLQKHTKNTIFKLNIIVLEFLQIIEVCTYKTIKSSPYFVNKLVKRWK